MTITLKDISKCISTSTDIICQRIEYDIVKLPIKSKKKKKRYHTMNLCG